MASNPATINLVQEIESVMSPIDVAALHSDQLRDLVVQTDVAIRQLQALQGTAMVAVVDESRRLAGTTDCANREPAVIVSLQADAGSRSGGS
jgi:hypothetical protein